MKHIFQSVFLILFTCSLGLLKAQSITGSWAGYVSGEYMEVNIQQRNNDLCGYTFDYELNNRYSYCAARFEGRYDPDKKIWYLNGTGFIENSGSHVLMRIIIWKNKLDGKNIVRGKVYTQSTMMSFLGMGGTDIVFKKIANKPKQLEGRPVICFPPDAPKKDRKIAPEKKKNPVSIAPKPIPEKTQPVKPVTKNPEKNDSIKQIIPPLAKPVNPAQLEKLMTSRKQTEQSRISIDVNQINLKVYDNGTVDNDSVSIFYNGRLLLSHQRLSEKAIEVSITLDEGVQQHQITMFAENLGSIAPNTALIVVTAGNKRYELRSKASLEENAVLVFDTIPK